MQKRAVNDLSLLIPVAQNLCLVITNVHSRPDSGWRVASVEARSVARDRKRCEFAGNGS